MIRLHRLGHLAEPFSLNPDLIVTVQAQPDTHIVLSTGTSLLVCETPDEVTDAVRRWRTLILSEALAVHQAA